MKRRSSGTVRISRADPILESIFDTRQKDQFSLRKREAIKIKILTQKLVIVVFTGMLIAALSSGSATAQEIRLRTGDRLDLEVPQRQELNRQLTISDEGTVSLPVIGEIRVEGMLLEEAQRLVLRRMREIYPSVQGIELSLLGEEARRLIYVHGEVITPGKYEFRDNPNVWEAVREAGGASATASLDVVRIIRAEEEGRRTFIVDLQKVIENGDFESLPELKPGDTVIVPPRVVQFQGSGSVRVIGSVQTPGPYKLSGTKTLTDAILAAGGPEDDANLRKVHIIRHLPEGSVLTIQVDYASYLSSGDARQNPSILPDDTVSIPKERNLFRSLFSDPRYLLGTLTATAALIAVTN